MEVNMEEAENRMTAPAPGVKALDSQTASRLRTAQVIVKISDVVRELVENSVDAGATTVKVLLEKHGLNKIEVRDDGQGINCDDMEVVFKGGYTSKLEDTTNLSRGKWLGFRGEALNAICASGKVTVISKPKANTPAAKYELDAQGNVSSISTASLNRGTVITVTNLFEKTPVRRQANQNAKVVAKELKEIETYLKGVAVANPKCHISLHHDCSLLWNKPSVQTIEQALIAVLGHSISKKLKKCGPMRVSVKDSEDTDKERWIEMYMPQKPVDMRTMSFTSNQLAMIFCNRKRVYIREYEKLIHRYITAVVEKPQPADQRRFPVSFLCIHTPPEEADFNRDMDKTKVFLVYKDIIYETLEEALIKFYEIDLRNNSDNQQTPGAIISSNDMSSKHGSANQSCNESIIQVNPVSTVGRQSTISEFVQNIPQNSDAFTKSPVKPPNSEPVAVTFPVVSKPQTQAEIPKNGTGSRSLTVDTSTTQLTVDGEQRRLPEVVSNFDIDLDSMDVTQTEQSFESDKFAGKARVSEIPESSRINYEDWLEGRMLDKNGQIIQNVVVVNQPPEPSTPSDKDLERFRNAIFAGKRQPSTSTPLESSNKRARMDVFSPHSVFFNNAPSTPKTPNYSTPRHRQVTLHTLSKWPTPTSVFSQAASNSVAGVRLPMTPISNRTSPDTVYRNQNLSTNNFAKPIEPIENQHINRLSGQPGPNPDQGLRNDRQAKDLESTHTSSADWPAVSHYLKSADRLPPRITGQIQSNPSVGPLYFAQAQESIGIFSPVNMVSYFPDECGWKSAVSYPGGISFSESEVANLFSRFMSRVEFNQAPVATKIFHVLPAVTLESIRESMKYHPRHTKET